MLTVLIRRDNGAKKSDGNTKDAIKRSLGATEEWRWPLRLRFPPTGTGNLVKKFPVDGSSAMIARYPEWRTGRKQRPKRHAGHGSRNPLTNCAAKKMAHTLPIPLRAEKCDDSAARKAFDDEGKGMKSTRPAR